MNLRIDAWALLSLLLGGVASTGCSPKIGDSCTTSTDCSVQGDRLCDPTQPGGYCTIFNCEPNTCPDNSVCVAFQEPSCSSPALSRRFQRAFCMAVCESNADCRAQYACLETTDDPLRQVVDVNPSSRKICAVPGTAPALVVDSPVCSSPGLTPIPTDAATETSASESSILPESAPEATPETSTDTDASVE